MAKKETDNTEYKALRAAEKDGSYAQLYIFHGEERYLLEHCLGMMRKMADQNGLGSFNHRRLDGKTMELGQLAALWSH
ncbi:MAG: DNA polymerase III subunit delta, partial [Oscillospiraceae bacterium]|nr:DNA polymerase III subunit delta [Oscillospiraceae bacterium]